MTEFFNGRTGHPGLRKLRLYNYAHRGLHDKPDVPENSLLAFSNAIRGGYGSELDVRLTADGHMVVFHDSTLKRCTGAEGSIEDFTLEELRKLRLEGTDEKIPLFEEVLEIYERSGLPLIIELKACRKNHRDLALKVCLWLDEYKGDFCIESFDPRAIAEVRKCRPNIIRGQLASDFVKEPEDSPKAYRRILTNLQMDFLSKPDFVAYDWRFITNKSFEKAVEKGIQGVVWTIRSQKDLDEARKKGYLCIFECFKAIKEY